jgi:large subunit ribosomal protein L24
MSKGKAKPERKDLPRLRIRKGDIVHVVAGKERGGLDNAAKRGKVLKVLPEKSRVVVERMNMIKRHTRPNKANQQGGIVEKEAPIHISNVMLVCTRCNRPTRVKLETAQDGSKVRVCKRCNDVID